MKQLVSYSVEEIGSWPFCSWRSVTEQRAIVYNSSMTIRESFFILLLLLQWVSRLDAAQLPVDDKRNEPSKQPSGLPLDRLPVPENGMIVVTPDLKKALDALGAGSVVLSAERYQELMNRTEKGKGDKLAQEMLFARCQITGEVKTVAGRELAELTFELEFRTEAPNAVVPVPFKGLRITTASLNGQPPVWGPDPEKWTLLIKEPQTCRLKLTASVVLSRTGNEKRVTLERLPASAITSLELLVPGNVVSPIIQGYGSITAQPGATGSNTLLSASALGVLSSLDLSWQTSDGKTPAAPPAMEGDVRITLEETVAQVEARLKPMPFMPITLPWKIRLPRAGQQLRAELLRSEGMNSEPLVATQQTDGSYILNSPYPLVSTGFTSLLVRWQVPLPEPGSLDTVLLGCCEVLTPYDKSQQGVVQVTVPDELAPFLRPKLLIPVEKSIFDVSKETRRQRRYRYTQLPAGLEVVAQSRAQARGVVEAKLQHTLIAQAGVWKLSTDVEILRSNRASIAQLELSWPEEWTVNRRLLFSPAVKDIEQDLKKGTLRIILDGRQPSQQVIRLEGQTATAPDSLLLKLPQLLSITGISNERTQPIEVVVQQETLKVDAVGMDLNFPSSGVGLREDLLKSGSAMSPRYYEVISHPASISVTRLPRLPKYSSQAEVFISRETMQTRQTLTFQSLMALPRQLQVLVPASVKQAQFGYLSGEGQRLEPLSAPLRTDEVNSPWKRYVLDLPLTTESALTLVCRCEEDSRHPLTVPLAKIEESQAVLEGSMMVQVHPEQGIKCKLPAEPSGWQMEQNPAGKLGFKSNSLQSFLVLDREEMVRSSPGQQEIGERSETRVQEWSDGYFIESDTEIAELLNTQWLGFIQADSSDVQLIGWKLNDRIMPASLLSLQDTSSSTQVQVRLPAEYLSKPVKVSMAWKYKKRGLSCWLSLPVLRWTMVSDELMTHRYLFQVEPTSWLWWSNLKPSPWSYPQQAWKPIAAQQMAEPKSGWSMELQAGAALNQVNLLVLPRSVSMLLFSTLAFLLVQGLARWPQRGQRWGWVLLVLWLLLYLVNTVLATVVLWGVVPGLALGLALQCWYRLRDARRHRKPVVFQSTPRLSQTGRASTTITPSRPPEDAPTILANRR